MEGNPHVVEHLDALGDVLVGISVVARGELMYMVAKSHRQALNLGRVQSFLLGIRLYVVNEGTSNIYGQLKTDFLAYYGPRDKSKRSRVTITQLGISDNDLWIASTAIQHGLTLVSTDSDFERISAVWTFPVEAW
jgi:tRNA(fMet)-specific endonuclease VapC